MFKKIKLSFIRHGQSKWNIENKFTGWFDTELTNEGKNQIKESVDNLIKNNNIPDIIFCSEQKRSIESSNIIINELNNYKKNIKLKKNWRLNERHWGNLTGYKKKYIKDKYGSENINNIIYSYNKKIPFFLPKKNINIPKYSSGNYLQKFTNEESKEDIIKRIKPYLNNIILPLSTKKNILIVGHSHSLRSIIIYLKNINNTEEIKNIKIKNGVPFELIL